MPIRTAARSARAAKTRARLTLERARGARTAASSRAYHSRPLGSARHGCGQSDADAAHDAGTLFPVRVADRHQSGPHTRPRAGVPDPLGDGASDRPGFTGQAAAGLSRRSESRTLPGRIGGVSPAPSHRRRGLRRSCRDSESPDSDGRLSQSGGAAVAGTPYVYYNLLHNLVRGADLRVASSQGCLGQFIRTRPAEIQWPAGGRNSGGFSFQRVMRDHLLKNFVIQAQTRLVSAIALGATNRAASSSIRYSKFPSSLPSLPRRFSFAATRSTRSQMISIYTFCSLSLQMRTLWASRQNLALKFRPNFQRMMCIRALQVVDELRITRPISQNNSV